MTPAALDSAVAASARTAFEASKEFDPNSVTPGVVGFFAIFLIAAVTVLLLLDMTRRVRRTRYRGEIAEQLDAEQDRTRAAGTGDDAPDEDGHFPGGSRPAP